nr:MAG TPA: hypothetical protein [Caudoviricetes sp.]
MPVFPGGHVAQILREYRPDSGCINPPTPLPDMEVSCPLRFIE